MSLFGYVSPRNLDEAVAVLAANPHARPLAGGHTLLLPASRSQLAGALLVDLGKIEALAGVELLADGSLKIGATTTLAALADSALIREQIPVLSGTALLMGDAQLRNRATIGGNIAAPDLGADLPALLLALNARIQAVGPNGSREILTDEFSGGELIVSITVPAPARGSGVAYEKIKHHATLFALCGVAAAVQVTPDGTVSDARIAVTGAVARPGRLRAVEQALLGKPANEASVVSAASAKDDKLSFFTDLFASAEYRGHLTHVLTERALKRAIAAATA